jgi:hypothetical protein
MSGADIAGWFAERHGMPATDPVSAADGTVR